MLDKGNHLKAKVKTKGTKKAVTKETVAHHMPEAMMTNAMSNQQSASFIAGQKAKKVQEVGKSLAGRMGYL